LRIELGFFSLVGFKIWASVRFWRFVPASEDGHHISELWLISLLSCLDAIFLDKWRVLFTVYFFCWHSELWGISLFSCPDPRQLYGTR
jgi:hypothetical protein